MTPKKTFVLLQWESLTQLYQKIMKMFFKLSQFFSQLSLITFLILKHQIALNFANLILNWRFKDYNNFNYLNCRKILFSTGNLGLNLKDLSKRCKFHLNRKLNKVSLNNFILNDYLLKITNANILRV